jgi:hypothetical protein
MWTFGPPAEQRTAINHTVTDANGAPVVGALVRFTDQLTGQSFERQSDGSGYSNIGGLITTNPYTWSIIADGFKTYVNYHTPTALGGQETLTAVLTFKLAGGATSPRAGIVRIYDRVWRDDIGPFRPLGATLFWSVWGWTHDRARLQQTFSWLQARGVDFIRILGDVDWSGWGMQMDSSAPDWAQVLGDVIDDAFTHNLRTELTIWGGSGRDPLNAARRAAAVVAARPHKLLDVEMSNEAFQNGPDDATIQQMLNACADLPTLLAPTTPYADDAPAWMESWIPRGADIGTPHPDRTPGEHGERCVRQMHDYGGMSIGVNVNEPIGPRSSVYEMTDPGKLAMLRGMGIFYGCGAFVLHNGNGVSGQPDPAHNREGDLWTVPGIDQIHAAVRAVDRYLPIGVETWPKSTQHGGWAYDGFADYGQPLAADAIWSDGVVAWGCDRCYGAVSGGAFVTMVSDIVDHVNLRAAQACDVTAIDCGSGKQTAASLSAGQVWQLDQAVAGTDLIINGTYR